MNYLGIYSTACDKDFQNRCRVAMWRAAQEITDQAPAPNSQDVRRDWAERVLREEVKITDRQLALQVLRKVSIADNPADTPDQDVQAQVDAVINSIIAIG
jgi:hypothetical protein